MRKRKGTERKKKRSGTKRVPESMESREETKKKPADATEMKLDTNGNCSWASSLPPVLCYCNLSLALSLKAPKRAYRLSGLDGLQPSCLLHPLCAAGRQKKKKKRGQNLCFNLSLAGLYSIFHLGRGLIANSSGKSPSRPEVQKEPSGRHSGTSWPNKLSGRSTDRKLNSGGR